MPISAVGRFFLHIQNGINRKSHESCLEKKKAGGEKGRRLRERREKKGSVMGFFRNLASCRNR